jgi:hypothetical protein
VLSEYSKRVNAFADLDQRIALLVEGGAVAGALQMLVVDGDGLPVPRPA